MPYIIVIQALQCVMLLLIALKLDRHPTVTVINPPVEADRVRRELQDAWVQHHYGAK